MPTMISRQLKVTEKVAHRNGYIVSGCVLNHRNPGNDRTHEGQAHTRLLYIVTEEEEEAAIAIVRRPSRAVPAAVVGSLGPVTKAEVKRRTVTQAWP